MNQQRVLVVEDDPALRRGVVQALRFHGYATAEAGDGPSGLRMALEEAWDLLLLDVILPGCDGLEIMKRLRAERRGIPVILLTARGEENDRVSGLKQGADDYVVKPFSVRELMARVEAVLRRAPQRLAEPEPVAFPGGSLDVVRREIRFDNGDATPLSERECELLAYLLRHGDRPVTRDEILAQVWRMNPEALETRTVDMHIARIREKLRNPDLIETLRGRGYRFRHPVPPA